MIKLLTLRANSFKQLRDIELRFPDRGSVLIEGRNEAGKSTLFEAVYFALFGKALLSGTTAEDLIAYTATEAIVELQVSVGDRRIAVQRRVRRTKTRSSADAKLTVFNADGGVEEQLSGPTSVNNLLKQELKLDADAFLNSCFVEQKKLEKLEAMNPKDREASVMRLLNLEQMQDQETRLKVTPDDRRALQRLRSRVELAETAAAIPVLKQQERDARITLELADIKTAMATLARHLAEGKEAEQRLATLEEPVRQLEQKVTRIEVVRRALNEAGVAVLLLGKVEDAQRQAAGAEAEISELDRLETEGIAELRLNLRRANVLRHRWEWLLALGSQMKAANDEATALKAKLESALALTAEIEELEQRIRAEERRLAEANDEAAGLVEEAHALDTCAALEDWLAAAHAEQAMAHLSAQMDDVSAAEAQARVEASRLREETEAVEVQAKRQRGIGAMIAGLGGAFFIAVLVLNLAAPLLAVAVLPVLIGVGVLLASRSRGAEAASAEESRRQADVRLEDSQKARLRLEGQLENAQASQGAAAGRLEGASIRFASLEETPPSSPDEARRRLAELPVVQGASSAEDVRQCLATLRQDVAASTGALEQMRKNLASRRREAADVAEPVLRQGIERAEQRAARIKTIGGLWRDVANQRAASLGASNGSNAGQEAVARFEAQIAEAQRRLGGRDALRRRVAELEQSIVQEREKVEQARKAIADALLDVPTLGAKGEAEAVKAALSRELQTLDEPGTAAALSTARRRLQDEETVYRCAQRDARDAEEEIRRRATLLRFPAEEAVSPQALAERFPQWESVDPARRADIEAEYIHLRDEGQYAGRKERELRQELNILPEEKLDPKQETAAAETHHRDMLVRERAIRILTHARSRIQNKVLPYTIEHMRRILPTLTMNRYHDAEIAEDYTIRVWDERASAWKSKNIFSGGTRDQFSLSLRLAFAMATLPQERGSAPGFIFLDEPLSSFDAERSDALMYLLTHGEVSQTFDQIFVISHSQSIAADEFQYRLKLDGGTVAEISDEMKPLAEQMALAEAA